MYHHVKNPFVQKSEFCQKCHLRGSVPTATIYNTYRQKFNQSRVPQLFQGIQDRPINSLLTLADIESACKWSNGDCWSMQTPQSNSVKPLKAHYKNTTTYILF